MTIRSWSGCPFFSVSVWISTKVLSILLGCEERMGTTGSRPKVLQKEILRLKEENYTSHRSLNLKTKPFRPINLMTYHSPAGTHLDQITTKVMWSMVIPIWEADTAPVVNSTSILHFLQYTKHISQNIKFQYTVVEVCCVCGRRIISTCKK